MIIWPGGGTAEVSPVHICNKLSQCVYGVEIVGIGIIVVTIVFPKLEFHQHIEVFRFAYVCQQLRGLDRNMLVNLESVGSNYDV